MHRFIWFFFVLCLAAAATFIIATVSALPAQVASHFGVSNAPNGYMTRDGYLMFMLFLALALPIFLAATIRLLPRVWPKLINLPNRDYWLEPSRREATLGALPAQGAWLGILTALFVAAIHYVLLVANASSPPHLPSDLFRLLLIVFLVAMALWVGASTCDSGSRDDRRRKAMTILR